MSQPFPISKGDKTFLKKRFDSSLQAGEKLTGAEFWMTIEGFPELSVLVQTTQIPELTREDVEVFAPSGVKMNQHGTLRNSGEFQFQFVETISGTALKSLKTLVLEKRYVNINIFLAPESLGGEQGEPICKLMHCKLYRDAVDFAAEDTSQPVRPSIRCVYNWQE